MKYYYNEGGQIRGPFEKIELIGKNITGATLVWVEGMATWMPASDVPMFADILDGSLAASQARQRPSRPTVSPAVRSTPIPGAPRPNYASQDSGYGRRSQQSDPSTFTQINNPASFTQPQFPNAAPRPDTYQPQQQSSYQQPPQQSSYQQPQPQSSYQQPQQSYQPPQQSYQPPTQEYQNTHVVSQPNYTAPVQPAYQQQPTYNAAANSTTVPIGTPPAYGNAGCPSTNFGWTVTGTVLSALGLLNVFFFNFFAIICILPLVLGIVGISKGNEVTRLWARSDSNGAKSASASAKSFGMWSVFINIGLVMISLLFTLLIIMIPTAEALSALSFLSLMDLPVE